MPNPPKKFLSKAQRIRRAQLPQASEEARIAGQNLRIMRGDPARFRGVTTDPEDEAKIKQYGDLLKLQTPSQKRSSSVPSSQVKKTKMSEQRLVKIGSAINTGLTGDRDKVLKALSKLPAEQRVKIFNALTQGGYAME